MTKIDRVITGLLYCTKEESYTDFNYCDKCPYYDDHCRHDEMLVDAAELLKRLVLCKDCKHWNADEHDCNIKTGWFACGAD